MGMTENTPTKGTGYPHHPVKHKDSEAEFAVRDADEGEAGEAAHKLKDDVDARNCGSAEAGRCG